MTRRNDRQLITGAGQPVRNRETWTVVGIVPDGSLSLLSRHGQGGVTVPASTCDRACPPGLRRHRARPPGRHRRRRHRARHDGEHASRLVRGDNPGSEGERNSRGHCEGRPRRGPSLLEGVLSHDRADLPTITQRRRLREAMPDVEAGVPARDVPYWVPPWRQRLEDRRSELLDTCRRADAIRDPVQRQIDELRPHSTAPASTGIPSPCTSARRSATCATSCAPRSLAQRTTHAGPASVDDELRRISVLRTERRPPMARPNSIG